MFIILLTLAAQISEFIPMKVLRSLLFLVCCVFTNESEKPRAGIRLRHQEIRRRLEQFTIWLRISPLRGRGGWALKLISEFSAGSIRGDAGLANNDSLVHIFLFRLLSQCQ